MKLTVLGAGRLGRRLIERLSRGPEPFELVGTTRQDSGRAAIEAAGARAVLARLDDPASLDRAVAGAELVVYTAAPGPAGRREEVYEDGLDRALQAARRARRFLFTSSTAVYSGNPAGAEVDEDSPADGGEPRGQQMAGAEARVRAAFGPGAQVARLAGLYSRGRGPFHYVTPALKAGQPGRGSGGRWLNLIHDEDAAAVLEALVRDPGLPLVLGADGAPGTRAELYGAFARARGLPEPIFESQAEEGYRARPRRRPFKLRFPSLAAALAADAV